jgi:hypothetical protein
VKAALEEIKRLVLTKDQALATRNFLREMGEKRFEGLIVWAGVLNGEIGEIRSVIIPRQTAYATESGLLLSIDDASLDELNHLLYERGLRMIAQVHSHGEHAYHSETDDEHSIVTAIGGWSIVVPHFAIDDDLLSGCAVLRLSRSGWIELDDRDIESVIEVV